MFRWVCGTGYGARGPAPGRFRLVGVCTIKRHFSPQISNPTLTQNIWPPSEGGPPPQDDTHNKRGQWCLNPPRNGGLTRQFAPPSTSATSAYFKTTPHTHTWPSFSGEKRAMSPSTSSDERPCGPGSPPVRSGFSQRAETETFPAGLPVASSTVTHSATTGRPSARGDRSIRASPIKPCSREHSERVVLNEYIHQSNH